jgi:hypothetical protein
MQPGKAIVAGTELHRSRHEFFDAFYRGPAPHQVGRALDWLMPSTEPACRLNARSPSSVPMMPTRGAQEMIGCAATAAYLHRVPIERQA